MSVKDDHTPASFKISISSVVESDRVLFNRESTKFFKIIFILIVGDFALTEYVFIHDYILLALIDDDSNNNQNKEIDWKMFSIFTSISFIFFAILIILLYLKKIILSKIVRFIYLVVGILYFIFQIILKMINLNDKGFSLGEFDIILFIILSLSIIPRITGFLYIRIFEKKIIKMKEAELTEERELLFEKVINNLDRSTQGNRILDKEIEKELEKEDEEILIKLNEDKKTNKKNKSNKKKENDDDKEEVADMD